MEEETQKLDAGNDGKHAKGDGEANRRLALARETHDVRRARKDKGRRLSVDHACTCATLGAAERRLGGGVRCVVAWRQDRNAARRERVVTCEVRTLSHRAARDSITMDARMGGVGGAGRFRALPPAIGGRHGPAAAMPEKLRLGLRR